MMLLYSVNTWGKSGRHVVEYAEKPHSNQGEGT